MAWFTGTSTGDRYTVGQVYANGNGAFRAEADGSFTNINSGRSLVGSSQDPRVTFGGYSEPSNSVGLWSHDPRFGAGAGSSGVGSSPVGPGRPQGSTVVASASAEMRSGKFVSASGEVTFVRGASLAPLTGKPSRMFPDERALPSQSGVTDVEDKPLKRIGTGGSQEAAGAISDIGWARTATGYVPVPGSDVKERIEDDLIQQGLWFTRNFLGPQLGFTQLPYPEFLEPGSHYFNSFAHEWQPVKPGQEWRAGK